MVVTGESIQFLFYSCSGAHVTENFFLLLRPIYSFSGWGESNMEGNICCHFLPNLDVYCLLLLWLLLTLANMVICWSLFVWSGLRQPFPIPPPRPPQVFPRITKEQKLRVWLKYRSKRMGYFTRMCLVVARVFGSFVEVVNRAKISEAPAIGKKKMGESLCFQRHTTF